MGAFLAAGLLFAPAAAEAKKTAHITDLGGYGTTEGVVLLGRALKGDPSSGARGRSRARKLLSTVHAFLRNDLEHEPIRITDVASGTTYDATTDDEGFYHAALPGPFPPGPRRFQVTLGGPKYESAPISVTVQIVDATADARVVITDIDDTILHTGVTDSKVKLVGRVAASSADDMVAVRGAATTLRALYDAGAPVIYVSGSPVELSPRIQAFLAENGFPPGPLFLRHFEDDGMGDPTDYKSDRIARILGHFPRARLLLFGDNGEADPEIYARLLPGGRVAAAFLRAQRDDDAGAPRYRGMHLCRTWADIARSLARHGELSWLRAQRVILEDARP